MHCPFSAWTPEQAWQACLIALAAEVVWKKWHAFYSCERVRLFWDQAGDWTALIEPKQLVLLDVGYIVDNVLLPFQGEKSVVFLVILAVARMVI